MKLYYKSQKSIDKLYKMWYNKHTISRGGDIMAKTATVQARIDPTLKENVERILAQMEMSSSDAIKLFYKQVELHGGLPFELKVPPQVLAEQKLMAELDAGIKSAEENGWIGFEQAKTVLGV